MPSLKTQSNGGKEKALELISLVQSKRFTISRDSRVSLPLAQIQSFEITTDIGRRLTLTTLAKQFRRHLPVA